MQQENIFTSTKITKISYHNNTLRRLEIIEQYKKEHCENNICNIVYIKNLNLKNEFSSNSSLFLNPTPHILNSYL